MIEKPELFVVEADWVVPVESEPIPNGFVAIAKGFIEFVGTPLPDKYRSAQKFHLAGFAILPGLINAHCHLEFSDLSQPLRADDSFPDWIRQVLSYRNSLVVNPEQTTNVRQRAIARGIRESYESGVRWVVDMTTQPWNPIWIEEAVSAIVSGLQPRLAPSTPIAIQPCFEIVDIAKNRIDETIAFVENQINAPERKTLGRMGYAPHAPYTASRNVTAWSSRMSQLGNRLVTMHLAESLDELEWLESRKGSFLELLAPILSAGYFDEIGQVSEHVQLLATAWRSMIAHGNYLSQRDLCNLAIHSQNMAIVYCPRTHRHFGHRHSGSLKYPLTQRLELGVRHLLGTDSRASNPDLNLWNEAKWMRLEHSSIPSISILKMITTDAAEFLDLQDMYGAIRVGRTSALTAVKLQGHSPKPNTLACVDSLYDALLASDTNSTPLEMVLDS